MKSQLEKIGIESSEIIQKIKTKAELDKVKVRFLGKKGELTAVLKQMGKLSAEERPVIGQMANEIRNNIEKMISQAEQNLRAAEMKAKLENETTLQCLAKREKSVISIRSP